MSLFNNPKLGPEVKRRRNKEIRLSLVQKLLLSHRGRRDYLDKSVRKNENGNLSSPFIEQEFCMCSVSIKREQASCATVVKQLEALIEFHQLQINSIKIKMARLKPYEWSGQSDSHEAVTVSTQVHDNSNLEGTQTVRNAMIESKMHQMDSLRQSVSTVESEQKRQKLQINHEEEISYLRCEQLINLAEARILVYWNGVLKKGKKDESIPSIPDTSLHIRKLRQMLDETMKVEVIDDVETQQEGDIQGPFFGAQH